LGGPELGQQIHSDNGANGRLPPEVLALPRDFNPVNFDPKAWAAVAKKAGMRYVVFTTKHHDGFCMFDTKLTDYKITSPEFPFSKNKNADVTAAIFNAFRAQGIAAGAYFSKPDWHSPYYWRPEKFAEDRNPNYDLRAEPEVWEKFAEFVYGQIEELMTRYGRVDILWLDGGQVRPPNQDINMERLVAMARRHQPDVLVVNRAARGYFEDYRTPENTVPKAPLLDYPWESCVTMAQQWSYKPNDQYKSTRQLIQLLVDVVAKGGNLLLNVGPQPDGRLPAEAVTRMQEIGQWMAVNSEAIYGTRVVAPYREGQFAFTRKGNAIYAIYLPGEKEEALPAQVIVPSLKFQPAWKVELLGSKARVVWHGEAGGARIDIPASAQKSPPCRDAFVFKITGAGIAELAAPPGKPGD